MRLHRVGWSEIAEVVALGGISGVDRDGRPIYTGWVSDGRLMNVVIALDDPSYVITVFGEVD